MLQSKKLHVQQLCCEGLSHRYLDQCVCSVQEDTTIHVDWHKMIWQRQAGPALKDITDLLIGYYSLKAIERILIQGRDMVRDAF